MQTLSSASRTHMAVRVRLRVNRHGGDAHLLAGADDPKRDLAAVGDQDLAEHAPYSITTRGSPNSTG